MAVPAIAAAAKAIAAAAGRAAAAGAAKKAGGGSWFGFLAVLAALVVAIVGAPAMLVGAAIITAAAAGGSAGSDLSPPDGDEDGSPQWLDEMMPICAGARLRDVDEVNGTTPGGTWDAEQLENARTITEVAMTLDWRAFYAVPSRPFPPGEGELWPSVTEAPAVPMQVLVTAMITAMQESSLRNLDHDDDAINPDGTIADGGGLFQQQPSQGWGTWDQITDPAWSTARFMLGVADLGDRSILGSVEWAKATPPEIAHAVQGNQSVDDYVPWWENGDAELLISRFLDTEDCLGGMELPLPGQYTWTSGYGPRNTGIPGASTWHPAWDFANGCNVPIYAIRPGSVTTINGAANTLGITDPETGAEIQYLHMYPGAEWVELGDVVEVGQQIGAVGNYGVGSGCHLDLRIYAPRVDGDPRITDALEHTEDISPLPLAGYVHPNAYAALFDFDLCPPDRCTAATTDGHPWP